MLCAVLPYGATRNYPHVHDDVALRGPGSLVADPATSAETLWTADFFGTPEQPQGHTGFWRPLVLWSFRVERVLSGSSEQGFRWLGHIVTILCHLAATLALWRLVSALGLAGPVALVAAAAFAVHPVHVESVAWLSGRVDSLPAAAGWAATALLVGERRTRGRDLAAAALFVGALLCKETALLLVGLAPLLARARGRSWGHALTPPAVAVAVVLGARAWLFGLSPELPDEALTGPATASVRWLTWLSIVPDLVTLGLWPGPATPIHPVEAATSWGAPGVAAGGVLLVVLVGLAGVAWRRRSPLGIAAWGLLAGTVVLLAPWVPFPSSYAEVAGPLYERYLYAAAAAPCLLLAWLARRPLATLRWLPPAVVLALLVGVGPVTAERCEAWSSDEAFARAGLRQVPTSANLWTHLGVALLDRFSAEGDRTHGRDALAAFERALVFDADHAQAHLNRFIGLAVLGESESAAVAAERLLERWPEDPRVLDNVAAWHATAGRWAEAATLYEREVRTGRPMPGAEDRLRATRAQAEAASR